MSVDLKRVRDAHDDGNLSPSSKKRLLAASSSSSFSTTGPPGAAGASRAMSNSDSDSDDNGIEDWMRVVETRRKEAIYRQMLEYKRASRDAAAKVRELEVQKKRLEASEHAVEACWTQVC
jgi:E3 ubiquitin-protein ligase BRE1